MRLHALRPRVAPNVIGFIALCLGVVFLLCCKARGDEPIMAGPNDPVILAFAELRDSCATQSAGDELDLSAFHAMAPSEAAAITPESVDLSAFESLGCQPTPNSQAEKVSVPKVDRSAKLQKLLDVSGATYPASAAIKYPQRGNIWTHPGHTRADLIQHLQQGKHAGKFDPVWLNQQTNATLEALHSDDHEGRATLSLTRAIAAATVPAKPTPPAEPKPAAASKPPVQPHPKPQPQLATVTYQSCPGGRCPTYQNPPKTRQRGPIRKLLGL